jgi:hypothetical protein
LGCFFTHFWYTNVCLSKFSWESTVTPKCLTFSLHVILFPNQLCLFVLGPMTIAWNLSGFAFIKFLENQSIKFMLSFSRVVTTVFILVSE